MIFFYLHTGGQKIWQFFVRILAFLIDLLDLAHLHIISCMARLPAAGIARSQRPGSARRCSARPESWLDTAGNTSAATTISTAAKSSYTTKKMQSAKQNIQCSPL